MFQMYDDVSPLGRQVECIEEPLRRSIQTIVQVEVLAKAKTLLRLSRDIIE